MQTFIITLALFPTACEQVCSEYYFAFTVNSKFQFVGVVAVIKIHFETFTTK